MIIRRYLTKEVFSGLLAVTGILLLIFMSNQFVRYMNWAAVGKYSGLVIMRLMIAQIPLLIGLILPLGFYLAVLLSYGRLYVDNEMTVLSACGVSQQYILRSTLVMALVVAIVVAFFMGWVNPSVMAYKETLLENGDGGSILQTVFPGHFESFQEGRSIYYVGKVTRNRHEARDIFMASLPTENSDNQTTEGRTQKYWSLLSAKVATEEYNSELKETFLVMQDGYRYFGKPGEKDFRIIKFDKYGIKINAAAELATRAADALPTRALITLLWTPRLREAAAELQWRASLPISTILLALLAIPLCRVRPRQGRYLALIPAILAYMIYANFMFVTRSWLEQGAIPIWLGVWWVHGLLLTVAILVWCRQFGWRSLAFWK